MRKGFTLVECMLASAILGFAVLVLFEGVGVCTRIAHENAQLLVAEAIAWDAAWKRFNESYKSLTYESSDWQVLSEKAAPALYDYDEAPQIKIEVQRMATAGWRSDMKVIVVDVAWGPSAHRFKLSDSGHELRVCRGSLGRAP